MPEKQEKPLKIENSGGGVSHHAFNADGSLVAVSPNNSEVRIFETNGSTDPTTWKEKQTLTEHAQFVSGIDWCAKTNKIVTCSHDRNAYVWELNAEGEWHPTLVVLRISRAATDVKWSPDGTKFAVTSGSKCVPVCHYDESQNWWIAEMIKKHKSTVLCVDWSPCSKFVVTGACDFKARIFGAKIDSEEEGDDAFGIKAAIGDKGFGESIKEFDQAKAWVNAVAWSQCGSTVAFAGQGATVHIVDVKNGCSVANIFSMSLPYSHIGFPKADDSQLVAVGFDMNPVLMVKDGNTYKQDKKLDPETDGKVEKKSSTARSAAFAKFQAADTRGSAFGEKEDKKEAHTFHKNVIVGVKFHNGKITTSCYDGRILEWKL